MTVDQAKIIIIGAGGQLGLALQARYPGAVAVDRQQLDLTSWEAVQAYDWSPYDIIINAAAYTNVDDAETAEGRIAAWNINATGPGYLARIASQHDMTLVHVSSDYVFDGSQALHGEQEPFSPLGVYGQSKAAGDIAVTTTLKHYILRTTWLIGDGPNFVRTMIGLADKNISPTVVGDQVGRLTFTSTLVDAIDHLLATSAAAGTYNLSNDGEPASWTDITRAIFAALGRADLHVTDTSTQDYFAAKVTAGVAIAPRPLQSTLDLSKTKASNFNPSDWHDELKRYIMTEQTTPKEATS